MKKINLNNIEYEIIEDARNGFDEETLLEKFTEYFYPFDYVVGDWAYGKLRLKGFYNNDNKLANEINNYKNIKKYIENNCAYGCKYFIIKKNCRIVNDVRPTFSKVLSGFISFFLFDVSYETIKIGNKSRLGEANKV